MYWRTSDSVVATSLLEHRNVLLIPKWHLALALTNSSYLAAILIYGTRIMNYSVGCNSNVLTIQENIGISVGI